MKLRRLGKTNVMVSEIALGTWQLGGIWGMPFDEEVAKNTLLAATHAGINCFDTADVYQGGASEKAIGEFNRSLTEKPFVVTKVGRKLPKQLSSLYTKEALEDYINDSRKRLDVDALDLVLLHCPPTDLYQSNRVFEYMDTFLDQGLIRHYGVSVETIEEAMLALERPNVSAIEIIFNMFRLKPAESFFEKAKSKDVGVIVRVPLASGLLTGKYHEKTTFNPNDHRTFNRQGEQFDKGETFSGVDYDLGLKAVDALKVLFKTDMLAPIALRWILMFDAVSTVIPGASNPHQILENVKASTLPPLSQEEMDGVALIYDKYIKKNVHHIW